MVIYRGADGKPGYHQTDDIHEAVGFVEQMRNEEGVEHARIFRLEEVVFEYRPYFRVELHAAGAPPALNGPMEAHLPEVDQPPPLNMASPVDHTVETGDSIDLVNDVIEVVDRPEPVHAQPEIAMAKKGLFGR